MRKFLFILFFILAIFLSAGVHAQENAAIMSLDIEGGSDNITDVALARRAAIRNALENAIIKATAQLMSMPASDERLLPVKSVIIDDTDKYVNNYKIVSETKKPASYRVIVNVEVNLGNLKNDLNKMGFIQVLQNINATQIVFIDIRGLNKYTDFFLLKDFLQSRKKIVKNIYACRFEWQQAHLEVEIMGGVQPLIDELTKTGRYGLVFGNSDKNQIDITCMNKKEEE